jgi:hypothetical protein
VYLIPQQSYRYEHPEHTGKDTTPFDSLWFCGIGQHRVQALQKYWKKTMQHNNKPMLAISLTELEQKYRVISFNNRPNPRQRRKKQRQKQQLISLSTTSQGIATTKTTTKTIPKDSERLHPANKKQPRKMSKYRDEEGNRKRKRF